MIGPERFSATGYFDKPPQCSTIEKTVEKALQRKLSKYHCQEWIRREEDGITSITQEVYVVPSTYMRAFIAVVEGEEPNLNMKSVVEHIKQQSDD